MISKYKKLMNVEMCDLCKEYHSDLITRRILFYEGTQKLRFKVCEKCQEKVLEFCGSMLTESQKRTKQN